MGNLIITKQQKDANQRVLASIKTGVKWAREPGHIAVLFRYISEHGGDISAIELGPITDEKIKTITNIELVTAYISVALDGLKYGRRKNFKTQIENESDLRRLIELIEKNLSTFHDEENVENTGTLLFYLGGLNQLDKHLQWVDIDKKLVSV